MLAGALAAGVALWARPRPAVESPVRREPAGPAEAPDPRLTAATPYRNVRPDVKYVGDEACARCHPAIAASFREHSMGQSLAPVVLLKFTRMSGGLPVATSTSQNGRLRVLMRCNSLPGIACASAGLTPKIAHKTAATILGTALQ